jgi:hypothetical protein
VTQVAGQRWDELPKAVRAAVSLLGLVALGAAAGILSLRYGTLALIFSGLVLAASFLLLKDGYENILSTHRWIPYAWVALCLAPEHHFTFHSTLDNSVSSATPENFVQVAVYMLVAALVLRSRRILVAQDPRRLRTGPLPAWPLIALLSTAWSLIPLFTFVRALQLFVPIGLALLMVRIWLWSPEAARAIWRDTLRLFVRVTTILILVGFATGFWREPRFTWPGAHPGVAAMYIGVALVILVAGGRAFLGLRPSGYVLRLGLFVATLYLGDTRGILAGVLVAFAVMLWLMARTKPLKSYLGMTYYAIAACFLLIAARPELIQYVLRGEAADSITQLNGRVPLWGLSIDVLVDAHKWLGGFGYGAARVILPQYVPWAGTAHSSWVEILLAIGVLGPLLLAADVLFVLRHALSRHCFVPPSMTVSILALLVVASITGEGLVLPGLAFVLLALLHVPVLAERNSVTLQLGGDASRESVGSQGHAHRATLDARVEPAG